MKMEEVSTWDSDSNASYWAYTDDYAAIDINVNLGDSETEDPQQKDKAHCPQEEHQTAGGMKSTHMPIISARCTAGPLPASLAARGCCNPYRWHNAWCKILFDLDGGDLSLRTHSSLRSSTSRTEHFVESSSNPERAASLHLLRSLVNDYKAAVERYAKIIISERDVEPKNRLLRPVASLGGFAGGDKYLVGGILFKFADGVPLPTELANKIPGIEFNSAMAVHDSADRTKARQLIVPLTCLVDYMGHRLEAVAFSPCGASTLVYGSSDAARTVFKDDKGTNRLMAELGERLCLMPHLVRERSTGKDVELILSDIEVHCIYSPEGRSRTKSYESVEKRVDADVGLSMGMSGGEGKDAAAMIRLVLDSSRLFPPLPPVMGAHKLLHLARRFRPELIALFGKPVNNDLYTNFQSPLDPRVAKYYRDLRECREFLSNQIHSAARQLYTLYVLGRGVKDVTSFCRSYGINMHLLGEVREAVANQAVQCARDKAAKQCCMAVLLTEIVARTLKNLVRSSFRKILKPQGNAPAATSARHSDFTVSLLGFLAIAFSSRSRFRCEFKSPPLSHCEEWDRAAAGGSHLKEAVHLRFRGALTAEEQASDFDLLQHGLLSEFSLSDRSQRNVESVRLRIGRARFMRLLLLRLTRMLGIRLSDEAITSCSRFSPQLGWPFDTRHVMSMQAVSKTIGGFYYMEGCHALSLARDIVMRNVFDVSKVKWFGMTPISLVGRRSQKRGQARTPGKVLARATFGYDMDATPEDAGEHLKLAVNVLSRATAIKSTDPLIRLSLAEALFLRGTFWCDLDDLRECHHHLESVSRMRGGSSKTWYKCVVLMKDLLYTLDRLSHRLMRKMLSLSSQITLDRSPEEIEEIGRVVHTLSCVAITARQGVYRHDQELQIIASLVMSSVEEFQIRVRWQNSICCCSNDSRENVCCGGICTWGRRGLFHPADVVFLSGFVSTIIWVLIRVISDADGIAGLTRENALAVALLSELLSSASGLMFLGVVSRKATKRSGFRRKVFALSCIFLLTCLVVGHAAIWLSISTGLISMQQQQRLRPVSTLALFFCSLSPALAWFLIQLFRVYYQVRAGNSAAMTAHNPYDFLEKCYIPPEMMREGVAARHRGRGRVAEAGGTKNWSVNNSSRVNASGFAVLRQSSRFGAMSRFSAGDLSERLLDGVEKDVQ